ncbi:MAG: DUF1998 domain-containing protein [Gemmatimonadaceae bacterium]|nr:DUF1998 domain-containing protein [Gloeobacterales cyanobacterium ES-bin-141]
MMPASKKRPPGELRRSQVLNTYGPGSMVDLPNYSVVIGGLNHWSEAGRKTVEEERLAAKVAELLGVASIELSTPPSDTPDPDAPRTGITAFAFPTWFLAQVNGSFTFGGREYRSRPLVPAGGLVDGGGRYLTDDRKKVPVVPVRFVRSCINGHLADIEWPAFVHADFDTSCKGPLWLDEGGSGSDFAEIFVRCARCGTRRPLSNATLPKVLGPCKGERPWLGVGQATREVCRGEREQPEYARLLVRSASNAYFSQTLSVISLPDNDQKLREAVSKLWQSLQIVDEVETFRVLRRIPQIKSGLEGLAEEPIMAEIRRRRAGGTVDTESGKSIKQVEIETLLSSPVSVGEDAPEGDFHATARDLSGLEPFFAERILRVVLVHRLREVIAQVGFTRFEPAMPDIDGELDIGVRRAALDIEPRWVPAIENRGEGVFIAFKKQAIEAWKAREAVKARGRKLEEGFETWLRRRGIPDGRFPGLPYLMLHSLSHLLITAVSLECGYGATAIRERIYTGDSGHGILLYTGSTGSEGTLGGLVGIGRRIEGHLRSALELGQLCSNDPVCAQHNPANPQEERFLHGAACHGCLLIAEPSCERGNEFLDRALVVPTVDGVGAEFFSEEA